MQNVSEKLGIIAKANEIVERGDHPDLFTHAVEELLWYTKSHQGYHLSTEELSEDQQAIVDALDALGQLSKSSDSHNPNSFVVDLNNSLANGIEAKMIRAELNAALINANSDQESFAKSMDNFAKAIEIADGDLIKYAAENINWRVIPPSQNSMLLDADKERIIMHSYGLSDDQQTVINALRQLGEIYNSTDNSNYMEIRAGAELSEAVKAHHQQRAPSAEVVAGAPDIEAGPEEELSRT